MKLAEFLASTPLLKGINAETLALLAEKLMVVTVPAHATLMQEGDPGDSLYLVQTGKLDIFLRDQNGNEILVSSLYPGDSVGEIGLLTGAIRSATVRTAEPSQLWQLTGQAFAQLSQAIPTLGSAIEAAMIEALQRAQLRSALYQNRLFAKLDKAIIPDFEQALEMVSLADAETLFRAGEASDALYVVINGCLRIVTEAESADFRAGAPLKEVGSGQIVGEIGIISGEPRTATVVAVRETLLGRLRAEAFYRLLQKYPRDLLQLTSTGIAGVYQNKTLRRDDKRNSLCTIAIFASGVDAPLMAFAQQLTHALTSYGSALLIHDSLVNHALGQPDIAHAPLQSAASRRLALWLDEQEARHDYLVYVGHETQTEPVGGWQEHSTQPWTVRCAQRADQILHVAWADSEARSATVALASSARRGLVLLHPRERQIPVGAQRWLTLLNPNWHHHLRWGVTDGTLNRRDAGDQMQRLARLLTGQGIGLVLSGGGARGFAHVGAIRALEEADIPIDLVGGTSMGAVVAGLSAIGHNADSMTEELIHYLGDRKQLTDFTLPLTSLMAGRKLATVMRAFYGDIDIVDTWRRFFCVSTDLIHAAEIVHHRGPMWQYVRASMSPPGIFPPQVDGDKLLVDGCLMNNYPANIMHDAYGCGTVIGVNVCGKGDLHGKNLYGSSLSGWAILNSKFNPFAKPIRAPGIFETINRIADLSTVDRSAQQRRLTDLFIHPPIESFGSHDFEQYAEIMEVGYRSAQSLIREWLTKDNCSGPHPGALRARSGARGEG